MDKSMFLPFNFRIMAMALNQNDKIANNNVIKKMSTPRILDRGKTLLGYQ
jgi:hypothetical protein